MRDRAGALCGCAAIAGNVAGVVLVHDLPSAYRPADMAGWVAQVLAHPDAVTASAIAFTLGLLALAGWAIAVGRQLDTASARGAGWAIAIAASIDAAGTLLPLVLARHVAPLCANAADCAPTGAALLGTSLACDALLNLMLGVGLVTWALALWRRAAGSRWLSLLSLVAGLSSVPVSAQFQFDWAARLLVIAGPLWLSVVAVTSVGLWRRRL